MERTSSKHSPRLDDEMEKEVQPITHGSPVESRAQEFRQMEGPGEDQPDPVAAGAVRPIDVPDGQLSPQEVEARSALAKALDNAIFPARREDLIANAEEHFAEERVVAQLRRLPDQEFENVQAIWEALGGSVEQRF